MTDWNKNREMHLNKMGIQELNEMQKKVLEISEEKSSIELLSPTGSGKTIAFLLPLLQRIDFNKKELQGLIIAPSRELAIQINEVIKKLSINIKTSCCYGGHSMRTELNNLKEAPAIIIGTPGRLEDHISRSSLDVSTIRSIILDEFDKALEIGFESSMKKIVQSLSSLEFKMVTSATKMKKIPSFLAMEDREVIDFLSTQKESKLELNAVRSLGEDKLEALIALISSIGLDATLVFCNHRDAVDRISGLLEMRKITHDVFHGGLKQDDRERALIKFRNGSHQLLVTTDLASRGLDIPEIKHVIHYQLPKNVEAFTHRNGRTARMHASGTSYLVLSEKENIPEYINSKPKVLELEKREIKPIYSEWVTVYFSAGKKDKINKIDLVGFLYKQVGLTKDDVGRIDVQDFSSFVAIKSNQVNKVILQAKQVKIKKQRIKAEVSR